jgi:rhodanese-related sulfurtransferase
MDINQVLAAARAGLDRLTPDHAWRRLWAGARLIDIRPEYQRRADGEIPGGIVIERIHLEWRCDPCSDAHIPEAADHGAAWIILCDEGLSSSLAAASLQRLGLRNATDVVGGFRAWRAAGLPIIRPKTPTAPRLPPRIPHAGTFIGRLRHRRWRMGRRIDDQSGRSWRARAT